MFPRAGQVIILLYVLAIFFVWLQAPARQPRTRAGRAAESVRLGLAEYRRPLAFIAIPGAAAGGTVAVLVAMGLIPPFGSPEGDLDEAGTGAVALAECSDQDQSITALLAVGDKHADRNTESALRSALGCFERALRVDSTSALAHARTALVWSRLADDWVSPARAYPRAKAAAEAAVRLNPNLEAAHTQLGTVLLYHDWNFARAEHHLRQAVRLNPANADAHARLADLLFVTGKHREALERVQTAHRLDPRSAPTSYFFYLMSHGQADSAARELDRHHSEEQPSALALRLRGDAFLAQGRIPEAAAMYQEAANVDGSVPATRARIARAHALGGERRTAREILRQLTSDTTGRYVRAEQVSLVYLALGDADGAMAMLEQAHRNRSAGLRWLLLDPGYRPLHRDGRFRDLVGRVGLR